MTLKNTYLSKKLLKWANKKLRILFYFKKTKKKTWRYHYFTPVHQKFRYDDTECDRLKLVIWSFFARLPPLKPQNIRILKNFKNWWGYYFTYEYQKPQSYEVRFLRYRVRDIFCHFRSFFALLLLMENQNYEKMKTASWDLEMSSFYKCVPKITIIWCMFPKISSVKDIIFSLLGHFLPFYPTVDPQNLEKM